MLIDPADDFARSQALREQGNLTFRSSRWAEAAQLYSQAIQAVSTPRSTVEREEHLAALYSNRAATRIQLYEYDLALLDATTACQLRPEWSRARAREAEAFSRLHSFEAARTSYATAVSLAEDTATKSRYMAASSAALRGLEQQQQTNLFVQAESSLGFADRHDAYVKGGCDAEKDGMVSAATAVSAWRLCEKAWAELDDKLKVGETGEVEAPTPSPVLNLADAIITDSRGFHIPEGKSHEHPLTDKLQLQLQWDAGFYGLDQFTKQNNVPRDVIKHFDDRRKEEGWPKTKAALAHLIRGSFIVAYMNECQLRSAEATMQYRFILGLLQEGRQRWADFSEEDKGSTFRFTFERKVKMHLLETIIDGHYRSSRPDEEREFSLDEAKNLAEEIMDDCATEKAPSDPVSTLAFQTHPTVAAGKAFTYALRHLAASKENRLDFAAGYWLHAPMMKACAKLYLTAGKLLPADDPERAINLFNALAFDIRGGGMSIGELFRRAAEAEAALDAPEKIFGFSSRLFDARHLVRHVCSAAQAHLTVHLPGEIPTNVFEASIKPVPTVFSDNVPEGKTWEELVEPHMWERFVPGDLAVAELISSSSAKQVQL
ncbi:hypothetical protein JCM11641_006662 [Rhodosporidiobolus odoratus]